MKTAYTNNLKDNIASATLLAAAFVAIIGSVIASNDAHAVNAASRVPVQKMDAIVVTAPRVQQIARMDTIVVTASRRADESPALLVASR